MGECDLCAARLGDGHSHLVHLSEGRLLCACAACALLLGYGTEGRYRIVPERVCHIDDVRLTDEEWAALGVPVDLVFFHWSSRLGKRVAFYPGPLGATECLLPLGPWAGIAAANPVLDTLEPDVEALLVNRTRGRREVYIVPIDACYHLVGLVRLRWRGISGGDVWEAVDRFFDELRSRSEVAA